MIASRLMISIFGAAMISFLFLSLLTSESSFVSRNVLQVGTGAAPEDSEETSIRVSSTDADDDDDDDKIESECGFVDHHDLKKALALAVCNKDSRDCGDKPFPGAAAGNGGFGTNMWATVVNRAGRVCAVVFSGEEFDDQWIGSRVISAQKAFAANAFSLDEYTLSTANLFSPTQNNGPLSGLIDSNPVDSHDAYVGRIKRWGESCTDDDDDEDDPLCGKRIGGINTFGGGLALYNKKGEKKGAIGISGDSSCADHVVAWKVRHELKLDYVTAGPATTSPHANTDQIEYAAPGSLDPMKFQHPFCSPNSAALQSIVNNLPVVRRP